MQQEMPELAAYFSSGSLVDAVLNLGLAAPIDVQVGGTNLQASYQNDARSGPADPRRSAALRMPTFRRISTIPR